MTKSDALKGNTNAQLGEEPKDAHLNGRILASEKAAWIQAAAKRRLVLLAEFDQRGEAVPKGWKYGIIQFVQEHCNAAAEKILKESS